MAERALREDCSDVPVNPDNQLVCLNSSDKTCSLPADDRHLSAVAAGEGPPLVVLPLRIVDLEDEGRSSARAGRDRRRSDVRLGQEQLAVAHRRTY
jgi:hypothetical protein